VDEGVGAPEVDGLPAWVRPHGRETALLLASERVPEQVRGGALFAIEQVRDLAALDAWPGLVVRVGLPIEDTQVERDPVAFGLVWAAIEADEENGR
jgi:hypothetical protein